MAGGGVKKGLRIALVTLVVALVGAEIAARVKLGPAFVSGAWVGPPQQVCGAFDPNLGWVNRPGSSSRIANEHMDYTVRINDAGLRDRAHSYAKAKREAEKAKEVAEKAAAGSEGSAEGSEAS